MVSVGPEHDNDDPEVDVNAMVAEVGAESVATVQAPTLRTRSQRHAARLARNAPGEQPVSPLHEQLSGVSDDGSDYLSASESDGASVGAPTRAHHVNDRSAPAFDMHACAQVLSQFSSQHVPAVNVPGGKAAAIAKSDKPKWDVRSEPFHTFKRRVMIWAESHCIEHLLTNPPTGNMSDFECHNVARRTILLALSATDTDYTADTTYLCEAWQLLLERHEPSRDIEVSDLYQKLSVATQRGRNMGEHVNECMTYRNRLKALGADIPREFFIQKLLDFEKEYMFMRASLRTQTPEQIVAALMEQYQMFQRHKDNDRRGGQAPAGQNRPRFNRPRGQGRPPAVAVAAIGAGGGEQRSCHHCGKKGHLRHQCPDLHPEVKKFLALGRGRGK